MKKVWKSLLFAMILTLLFGLTSQAAVKKITIKKPTKKSITTVTLNEENPTRVLTLKWNLKTSGSKNNTVKVKSSNKKVVSVKKLNNKSATLTAKKAGTATITVYGANGKVKDTLKITVKQKVTEIDPKYQYVFVEKGKSVKLQYTVLPKTATSKKLTFKSSKKGVATVSASGKVTGKKAGTATITAKAKDGSGTKVKFYITVGTKKTKVTKVKASAAVNALYPGQTTTISASVAPKKATNKTVRYTTSDKTVATVSKDGVITAVKPGTAKIKVIANDGSRKSKTITITVKQPVTVIGLSASSVVLNKKAGFDSPTSVAFAGVAAPSNAADKTLKYTSSDEKVAVYENGRIVAKGVGTCVITVTAADGQGAKAVCSVTVKDVNTKIMSVDTSKFNQTYNVDASIRWTTPETAKKAFNELTSLAFIADTNKELSYKVVYNNAEYTVKFNKDGMSIVDPNGKERMDDFLAGRLMKGTVKRNISAERFSQLFTKLETALGKVTVKQSFGNATVTVNGNSFAIADVVLNGKIISFKLDGSKVTAALSSGYVAVLSEGDLDKAVEAVSAITGETLAVQ